MVRGFGLRDSTLNSGLGVFGFRVRVWGFRVRSFGGLLGCMVWEAWDIWRPSELGLGIFLGDLKI